MFKFAPDNSGFGNGMATIVSSTLRDGEGNELRWIVGGEVACLEVEVNTNSMMESPIIGFFLKDRLGQILFGDNTYLSYEHDPVRVSAGEKVMARFEFVMPILPQGKYSFDIAVANGTHDEHEQADWIHDGLVVESHTSSVSTGLVGIPFRKIELEKMR